MEELRLQIQRLQHKLWIYHVRNVIEEVPEFEEEMQQDEFFDWLNTVERMFEYHSTLKHRKVKLVVIKLRKHTSFL